MVYLKIVVKIPDTIYPELVADLQRVQLRDRAERIRVLALLGLRHIQHSPSAGSKDSKIPDGISKPEALPLDTTSNLIKRLADSL